MACDVSPVAMFSSETVRGWTCLSCIKTWVNFCFVASHKKLHGLVLKMAVWAKRLSGTKWIAEPLQQQRCKTVIRGRNKRLCTATPANLISFQMMQWSNCAAWSWTHTYPLDSISAMLLVSPKLCAWHVPTIVWMPVFWQLCYDLSPSPQSIVP